jgi:hypothetical protein
LDRPILFSTPMVQAILKLIKKSTRRPIKITFLPGYNPEWTGYKPVFEYGYFFLANSKGEPATKKVKSPCMAGDTLWVRETWCRGKARNGDNKTIYKADIETDLQPIHDWKPSIHMRREAARLFLTVKNVRVERLQEITAHECVLEGIDSGDILLNTPENGNFAEYAKSAFEKLWDSCYQWPKSWLANPWVWAIEFEFKEVKV